MRNICSSNKCRNFVVGQGLCSKHYWQYRTNEGYMDKKGNPAKHCSVEGCSKVAVARNLCVKHYTRLQRHGDPLKGDRTYRHVTKQGYVKLNIHGKKYFEHRVVMEKYLGRLLSRSEHIHHINGDRSDNRVENLRLMSQADHNTRQFLCSQCELRKQIRLLQWQIKEQSQQIKELTQKLMGI